MTAATINKDMLAKLKLGSQQNQTTVTTTSTVGVASQLPQGIVNTVPESDPTKVGRLFINSIPNCRFIFKNGKAADFLNNEFVTDVEEEIAELEAEIKAGNPYISVDKARVTVSLEPMSAIDTIKAQAIAEFLAANPQLGAKTTVSESEAKPQLQGMVTSADISDASSGSSSAA